MKANPLASLAISAVLAATASCAAVPPPPAPPPVTAAPPAPVRTPPPAPLPAPPQDWRDAPATPGVWRWTQESSGPTALSVARFGRPGQPTLASLTCNRAAGQVLLGRAGTSSEHVPMQVTTTTGTRPLLSEPLAGSAGELVAVLRPGDGVLDAIAYSRGRFAFEAQGLPTLYLPAWPELSRVIEDCR